MSNATTTTTKRPAQSPAAGGDEGAPRLAGAKPQLLAQLPLSVFASPGFLAGIIAMECLYGLMLFAVMSSIKRERLISWGPEVPAEVPRVEPLFVPRVASATPAKPVGALSSMDKADGARGDKNDAAGNQDAQTKDKSKEATSGSTVVAQNTAKAPVKKAAKKKGGTRKKKQTPNKAELALASPSGTSPKTPEEPPPPPREIPTIAPLGSLIDPLHGSQVLTDAEGLTIKVPKGLYIFDAKRNTETAPRALTPVEGDFVAEVNIPGELRAPVNSVKGVPVITFQGAGLLLWQDSNNYVRLERVAMYTGKRMHKVMFESCKDGKQGKNEFREVREGTVRLRMERRGTQFTYSYTTDGKTWLKFLTSTVNFPPKLSIGISASNASPKSFSARFEGFVLKGAGKSS